MTSIQPFRVDVPDETLEDIKARVAAFPWREMPDDGGWEYGTSLDYMKELCEYWVAVFDWRKQEEQINRFSHFKTSFDGIDIHFSHEKGSGFTTSHSGLKCVAVDISLLWKDQIYSSRIFENLIVVWSGKWCDSEPHLFNTRLSVSGFRLNQQPKRLVIF